MPAPYWYYALIIISLVLLAGSLIYRRDWRLLVLQVNIAGIIHPFEITVLVLMNGYCYLPGILSDSKLDNYLGSYVSNSFIVPASAVIINAFSLSWGPALTIATIFTGVDWYFTTLGIYKHFWWKSIYTGIGLSILYALSRRIWSGLQEQQPLLIFRLLVIYLTYTPIYNLIIFIANKGGQLFRFQAPWPGNPEKCHQTLFFLYLFITSIIVTLCIGLKLRLRYRLMGMTVLAIINWAIGRYQIFVPQVADLSAQQLIIVPIITVPIVIILFYLAKLDYLFP